MKHRNLKQSNGKRLTDVPITVLNNHADNVSLFQTSSLLSSEKNSIFEKKNAAEETLIEGLDSPGLL